MLAEFRNPVAIITKNRLVCRDIDLLADLARHAAVVVFVSITTLENELASTLEPRARRPTGRLAALEELTRAGVPVGVMTAPFDSGAERSRDAGHPRSRHAGWRTMPGTHSCGCPGRSNRCSRAGSNGTRRPARKRCLAGCVPCAAASSMIRGSACAVRGEGAIADQIAALFRLTCRRLGLNREPVGLSTAAFRRPQGTQGLLFE